MPGRGGSSAMPHKRNPVSSTVILAAHTAAQGPRRDAARCDGGGVPAAGRRSGTREWHALPQLFGLASGALREARTLAEGLVVAPGPHARRISARRAACSPPGAVASVLAEAFGRRRGARARRATPPNLVRETGRSFADIISEEVATPQRVRAKAATPPSTSSPRSTPPPRVVDRAIAEAEIRPAPLEEGKEELSMPHVRANGVEPPLRADRPGRRAGGRLRPFDRRDARTCGTRRSPPSPAATAASATTRAAMAARETIDRAGRRSTISPTTSPASSTRSASTKAHVVGLSLGGMTGQAFALRHPDRLDRLALIATSAEMDKAAWRERIETVRTRGLRRVHRRDHGAALVHAGASPQRARRSSPASARGCWPTTPPAMRPAPTSSPRSTCRDRIARDHGADPHHRRRRRPGDAGGDVGADPRRASPMPRWS